MREWNIQLTQELALPEGDNEKDSHECRGSHSESINLRYTYVGTDTHTHTAYIHTYMIHVYIIYNPVVE